MLRTYNYALLSTAIVTAFDPNGGKWKLDADGKVVLNNGNPVYVQSDGTEQSVDGGTISRLNGEAKQHRVAKEAAEAALKKFEGLDPEKARVALETVGKIDQKKLIDAGEVDKVKAEISAQYTAQLAEKDALGKTLQQRLDQMTLATAFSQSDFIKDRIAIPPEMFQTYFEKNFKIEDGKIVPYDPSGSKLFSKDRMGEIANFDEAIAQLVDVYPHKNSILKANPGTGSGNNGNGGGTGNRSTMRRGDFDKLEPARKAEAAAAMGSGKLVIVD